MQVKTVLVHVQMSHMLSNNMSDNRKAQSTVYLLHNFQFLLFFQNSSRLVQLAENFGYVN